MSSKGER